MKYFRCLIHGKDFPFKNSQEEPNKGFYTTRCVQAKDEIEAEQLALDNLRAEIKSLCPEMKPNKEAKVYFEEIVEVAQESASEIKGGFTFYEMGT